MKRYLFETQHVEFMMCQMDVLGLNYCIVHETQSLDKPTPQDLYEILLNGYHDFYGNYYSNNAIVVFVTDNQRVFGSEIARGVWHVPPSMYNTLELTAAAPGLIVNTAFFTLIAGGIGDLCRFHTDMLTTNTGYLL